MQRRRTYGHAVISCNTFITFIELQEALLLMHVNDSTFSTDLNTIMCCYVHLLISLKVIHVQTLEIHLQCK